MPFLIPANVCGNVPETLEEAGVEYRFVDIDARTLCMDEQYVLDHAKEISGIVMVHTYGVETDFAPFYRQLREKNPDILIVDDRCLCMPSFEPQTYDADMVLYSFSEKKQVNLGKGSMAYVSENVLYEENPIPAQSFLTNEGWILNKQNVLATMDAAIAHKEKLNAIYRKELPKSIQLPEAYQHWRFNILVENKEEILKALFDAGLFASSHYKALCEQPAPVATNLSAYVINLFNDSYFTAEQAKMICKIINEKTGSDI
jgi:dTDP-4-amino-4,6-dideoxygalactose transaminase